MSMNVSLQIPLNISNSSTLFVDILFQKILLGFLLFSLSIFTIFGNLLVLYAIGTEKRLRAVSNLFILSLAFADLIVGIFVMPLSAANIMIGQWPFSFVLCQIWLSTDYVASTASIFNLVLLSLDRYWAVVHPLLYLQNRTFKRTISFIIIVWLISLLWVPAIIFWSHIMPEYSDIIKSTECDTSFRSNKLFKTLTALINFYIPLLTIIIISCRIMITIHSRSTMEFGRRISLTRRKQMQQDRTYFNSSIRHDSQNNERKNSTCLISNNINEKPISVSIIVNPFDPIITNPNISSYEFDINSELLSQTNEQNNNNNNNIWELESNESSSIDKTHFQLSHLKPIKILFSSLSSITNYNNNNNKRKSEDLSRNFSHKKLMKISSSVSNNMKYAERQSNITSFDLNHLPRTLSTTSNECQQTMCINPIEQDFSIPIEDINVQTRTSSYSTSNIDNRTINSNNHHIDISVTRINNGNKISILTFFDYIINPNLSRSLQKELKAARQLGLLVGVFTITWLPYFILFLVIAWCHNCVSDTIFTVSIWLGYLNSTFNPLIYPLCNTHFRHAFKRILFCKSTKMKITNQSALSELYALHSIRRHR
ncbi:unnamed protein product [Rotaria sordida]|uniref:G-protein coupled receptors family 1 profile domain-containing protein n=1 Tax=Rotaria sordida TaxID=392033 RepID=A0A814V6H2_9BILA|nr:unnamed protein product [Rotaria sordida]CAF3683993.1 unnamed protein product [Rotaria sordida]